MNDTTTVQDQVTEEEIQENIAGINSMAGYQYLIVNRNEGGYWTLTQNRVGNQDFSDTRELLSYLSGTATGLAEGLLQSME